MGGDVSGDGQVEFVLEFPEEGGHLARDGDDGLVLPLAPGLELDIAPVQPVLHAPGERLDLLGLPDLSLAQSGADLRRLAVVLAALTRAAHLRPSPFGLRFAPSKPPPVPRRFSTSIQRAWELPHWESRRGTEPRWAAAGRAKPGAAKRGGDAKCCSDGSWTPSCIRPGPGRGRP